MWAESSTCPSVGPRVTPGSAAGAPATPHLSLRARWAPEPRPSAQPPAPPGAPAAAALQGQPRAAGGAPGPAGPVGTLGSWAAAAHPSRGGWLPASLPWVLGPCPGVLPTISWFPVATSTGQPALCTCTLARWGPRQAITSWGWGLPSRGRSRAGSSCPGWLAPPRVVLAYVPGGPTGPWGGLGPSQAGKGWGPRDGFQGCGPQALTAQAPPRGCGRWQRQGALAFLLREECGSGSPHTMAHVGPGRAGGQNGGTRPSLPLWPWRGQWKAVVGQVPGRLAAGRQAATHHRGTCRGHADSAEPRRPGWLEAAPSCQTAWGPSFPWRGRPFTPCRLSNCFPHPEVIVNKDIVCQVPALVGPGKMPMQGLVGAWLPWALPPASAAMELSWQLGGRSQGGRSWVSWGHTNRT